MHRPLTRALLLETIETSKMTRWFDLKMLSGTLRDLVISTLIGGRLDVRAIMAGTQQEDYFDYDCDEHRRTRFWFDYTADVGDGWNSTYAIASLLCDTHPKVAGADDIPDRPGRLLILGGDAVYPSASREAYSKRLVVPYSAASYTAPSEPVQESHLFVIPGNHDWYDGLGSFLALFTRGRAIGRFRTRQRRSYFALKLPHGHWLLAVDCALTGEIDPAQEQYFHSLVRNHVQDGATFIVCTAQPDWVSGDRPGDEYEQRLFDFEEDLLAVAAASGRTQIRIVLRLSGDLHCYKHIVSEERGHRVHNLIAGGGGAFLHPTHNTPLEHDRVDHESAAPAQTEFRQIKSFPSAEESRQQTRGSLFLLRANHSMWLVLLVIYLMSTIAYSLAGSELVRGVVQSTYGSRAAGVVTAAILQLGVLIAYALALFGCCYALVDVSKKRQRTRPSWEERDRARIAAKHALVHVLPYSLLQIANSLFDHFYYSGAGASFDAGHTVRSNLIALSIAVSCSLLSALVFWAYLRLSLNRFGRHENDAFAALRIEDYKNFLRIAVDEEGLTIYAVGLRKVPRRWDVVEPFRVGAACVVPARGEELRPELIERIVIRRT